VFDDFIFVFFAMEMVLKMVALGIFGKKCYLGDTWNRLDFFIVMAGMVEYSLDLQNINLSAIRTVRVLRPLKAINRVPSMRILVNLLLDTLPMLGNVLLLCFFVFFIFGIIGVQLWAGLLRNRCFLEENFTIQGDVALPPYYQPEEDDEMPFICSLSGDNGIMGCHEIPPLKEQGRECCLSKDDVYDFGAGRQDLNASGLCVNWNRYYNVCRTGSANPHKGAINFDNIGYAWIPFSELHDVMKQDCGEGLGFLEGLSVTDLGQEVTGRGHRSGLMPRINQQNPPHGPGIGSLAPTKRQAPSQPGVLSPHNHPQGSIRPSWPMTPPELHKAVLELEDAHHVGQQKESQALFSFQQSHQVTAKPDLGRLWEEEDGGEDGAPARTLTCGSWSQGWQSRASPEVLELMGVPAALWPDRVPDPFPNTPTARGADQHPGDLQSSGRLWGRRTAGCRCCGPSGCCGILGMHIFGCKFSLRTDTGDTVPDRKNFDSLLWAIVTVFQILTQEDWNVVLYNGMASTSPWASLYFVALMTFGNYVLFNLLVAILVEGFQAEGDANRSYSDEDQSSSNMEEFDKLQEGLDSGGGKRTSTRHLGGQDSSPDLDPKLCPIPMTPNGHLDPNLPLGGHLGPTGAAASTPRLSLQPDPVLMALGSRKSSVMSLGRVSYDQRSLAAGPAPGHEDCNGRMPSIAKDVFTKMDDRRDRGEDEEEMDYTLCFRVRKMIDVYKPDWCEVREDWSVYLFSPENRFRVLCQTIIAHKLFDYVVLAFIFLNCITIALERPQIEAGSTRLPNPGRPWIHGTSRFFQERIFLTVSNYIFTAIFVGEMTLKHSAGGLGGSPPLGPSPWVGLLGLGKAGCGQLRARCPGAHNPFPVSWRYLLEVQGTGGGFHLGCFPEHVVSLGLYFGEQAYLRSSWNVLDGFLVFVSIIDIVVSLASAGGAKILGVLRVLRLLRTLRPLRVISRAPGLKLVVETLISSLKPIGNIVLICCAFFIIFGILGVQLFKGKFYHCLGIDTRNITNRSDCVAASYRWVHHKYNFDNLGQLWRGQMQPELPAPIAPVPFPPVFQALMSLFVLASKDGWVNIMYNGLDAVAVDQQPVPNHNPWMLLYFISFLLIVSFFVLNMFVGVVVENFHKCRQHQEAEEARRREEKRLRRLEKKRRSEWSLETALKYCNYMFTTVFVLEAVLKLVAFGLRRFFKDRWNQLDLAIVLLSVMGITLEEIEINAALPINPTIIRIMRVGNLGLLFMLLFFIYAALGVELFGKLVCNDENPCEGMSRHATFENFGMAFLTLFQVSTGDNWNGIMKVHGELTIIDNLSGSIFHHYSSPTSCEKLGPFTGWTCCPFSDLWSSLTPALRLSGGPDCPIPAPGVTRRCRLSLQVQLAETEAFSLNSDRSSSILLGDDLSLEDPAACPPGPRDSKGEPEPPEPMRVGDLGECFFPLSNTAVSLGPENFLCEMESIPFNPVRLLSTPRAAPPSRFSPDASSPLLPMPAEFFHPAVAASQKGQEKGTGAGTLPKIALQGSWASLRLPSVNCTLLQQEPGLPVAVE
ncbi:hypothetical protein E2I00_019912, partial [Balaenoptera physalus]